jgi:glycosyltransferase involved in cell wall biosynthesis
MLASHAHSVADAGYTAATRRYGRLTAVEGPAPEVSVVIACRNAGAYLTEQLEALAAQQVAAPWELIVADNGSTDGSAVVAAGYADRIPGLRVIDASSGRGPGGTRNVAVAQSRARSVLFCDADDVVAPGWLAAMVAALQTHELVAARLEHDRLNEPWTVLQRNPQAGLLQTDPPFLPYAFAAALGVRRELHERLGGFDATYLAGGEDRDYCYRAQLAGVTLTLVPDAVVHYRHRRTARGMYRQAYGYAYGQVRLYKQYRDRGLGRPPTGPAIVSWLATPIKLLPALRSRERRAQFMARLGWRVGRLAASVRHRVWAI